MAKITKPKIGTKTPYEDACKVLGNPQLSISDFKMFPEDQREYMHSMHRIVTVKDALKAKREFDWNNRNERKYFAWWNMETYGNAVPGSGFVLYFVSYANTVTYVGARLSDFSDSDTRFVADNMKEDSRNIMK